MFYYAQLNDKGICVAVSQLSQKVERENMIGLESYDTTLCGKKYNKGKWEEVYTEPLEPEPTLSSEELQAEILLNQQQIITRQNTQEAVLAQLLLNQQGGAVSA